MSKTPDRKEVAWKHAEIFPGQKKREAKCKYCKTIFHGGINRLKYHLARVPAHDAVGCPAAPIEVVREVNVQIETFLMQKETRKRQNEELANVGEVGDDSSMPPYHPSASACASISTSAPIMGTPSVAATASGSGSVSIGPRVRKGRVDSYFVPCTTSGSQPSLESMGWNKDAHDAANKSIADFWYYSTIPFHVVRSPFWQNMVDAINIYGARFKAPTEDDLKGPLLSQKVADVKSQLEEQRLQWKSLGYTIMTDGWTNRRNRMLLNCGWTRVSLAKSAPSPSLVTMPLFGLRALVDFLPASIATIVSYFSAEVTRGVWKPASMNGTDWPSPAANLFSIEAAIKEILADTGVHVPSLVIGGNTSATLPLPLAALVSLTITFKLDKHSELMTGIAGLVLGTAAAGCPWPCMPIVAALWCQKVRRWHDFIVFCSSRTVFMHDKHALVQLLKSCFAATLGSTNNLMSKLTAHGGIGALLGHGYSSHSSPCGTSPAAPGFLYLRTYNSMYDIKFVAEEILSLVVGAVKDFVNMGMDCQHSGQSLRAPQRLKSQNVSLANVLERAKLASSLGASLLSISGGLGLVQMLYQETLPTWFLSGNRIKTKSAASVSTLEGYTIAQFSFLCGAYTWGVDTSSSSKKRAQIVGNHMDFLASAIDGNMSVGCEYATWRAYVLGFLAMVINCSPNWICEVDIEILKRLAARLKWWHEPELALALLERGGPLAMNAAAELVSSY